MKLKPQVSQEHYKLENYVTHERWHSYFNQVREALKYRPKNILVIGPGDGIVVNILKGYGIEVMTVDIDENHHPDVLASVDDLRSRMPQIQFDVVLCCQVLEHLPYEQLSKCLESIKEFSRGIVIISLPEKSLRTSFSFKPPVFRPFFINFVIPLFWVRHKFDGEHYWELNAKGTSVRRVASLMGEHFKVKKYYRLKSNPYHFFFILQKKVNRRIFLLSDGKNPHTIKWARGLASEGIDVFIYSISAFDPSIYKAYPNIQCAHAGFGEKLNKSGDGALRKIVYLKTLRDVKKYITDFDPDIVHAHFSSSYGLLGALSRFRPYFISVWGADVYDFPRKSFIHQLILKFNLKAADRLFSTSYVMATETQKYTSKEIEVIPFGVDLEKFSPGEKSTQLFSREAIVIGSVKALEEKYGMDVLIHAFAVLKKNNPMLPLKLLIVGRGTRESELKSLVSKLGIAEDTVFTGFVPVETVPVYQNMLDVAVFPSVLDSESFGVSVIEANACGKPVVVSNKGGLPEVVENGVTGFVVPANDHVALAAALEKLINDPYLRTQVGLKGRERVKRMYDWKNNLVSMIKAYERQL